jgi:hypothetical protein
MIVLGDASEQCKLAAIVIPVDQAWALIFFLCRVHSAETLRTPRRPWK